MTSSSRLQIKTLLFVSLLSPAASTAEVTSAWVDWGVPCRVHGPGETVTGRSPPTPAAVLPIGCFSDCPLIASAE